jgi:hypothetical protein
MDTLHKSACKLCINLDDNKLKKYIDKDPRYNFTIEDSDQFNKTIYPLHIKKVCKKNNKLDASFPRLTRCWGERYENCIDPKIIMESNSPGFNAKFSKSFVEDAATSACTECNIDIYDNLVTDQPFKYKKQKTNIMYDQTRISKILHPIYDSEERRLMDRDSDMKLRAKSDDFIEHHMNVNHSMPHNPGPTCGNVWPNYTRIVVCVILLIIVLKYTSFL